METRAKVLLLYVCEQPVLPFQFRFRLCVLDGAMHKGNLVLDLPRIRLLDDNGFIFQLVEDRHCVSEELAVSLCLDRGKYLILAENAIVEDASVLSTVFISGFFLLLYQISLHFHLIGVGRRYLDLCYLHVAARFNLRLKVVALDEEQIPLHVQCSQRVIQVINEEISKRILWNVLYFQKFFCVC